MVIISERGINIHFYPIVSLKGRKLEGDYVRYKNKKIDFIAEEGSRWDYNCYRLMDFLSTCVREVFDQTCIDQLGEIIKTADHPTLQTCAVLLHSPNRTIDLDRNYSADTKYIEEMRKFYSMGLRIPVRELLKAPSLKGIHASHLRKTIEKTSSCRVKVNYQFKSQSDKEINGYRLFDFKNKYCNFNDDFTNLFDYEYVPGKQSMDGKHYNAEYKFKFGSVLAGIFVHNIVTGGYSLIDESFYNLSKYANILFRMFLLNYTDQKTIIDMNTATHRLGFTNSNPTERKNYFIKLINELFSAGLISLEETINTKNSIRYIVKRKKWK